MKSELLRINRARPLFKLVTGYSVTWMGNAMLRTLMAIPYISHRRGGKRQCPSPTRYLMSSSDWTFEKDNVKTGWAIYVHLT